MLAVLFLLSVVPVDQVESYNHIDTPYYKVILTSSYEDNLLGVHLKNKEEQDAAMQEFVAGRLAAGEMGNGVELEDMKPKEKKKKEAMYQAHGFDEYISEYLVSLNRSLPDRRDDWCKLAGNVQVPPSDLPPTSIIIIFHNEAWSTLIRTIYSVVNRSPDYLIQEILLVDDASTLDHLGARLEAEVGRMEKVRLLRLEERGGLMRARMAGIEAAKADVLTFLDSHIEATEGWLEPLLERVHINPRAVACPVIEEVNDQTFQYKFVTRDLVGVFYWSLDFSWQEIDIPDWSPYATPVMAGGLFTIRKDWFAKLGFYDEGMEIWGGEQLELSFKTWMCGGSIEIVPCSRVGHIFRTFSPYKWTAKVKLPEYNYKRVAEVWMDDYKDLYYDRLGKTGADRAENVGSFGDVKERKELRDSLQCHSFAWYLDNQMPDLFNNKIIGAGEIRNFHHQFCLDQQDTEKNVGLPVLVFDCHGQKGNQYWYLRQDGSITRDFLCVGRRRKGSSNDNHVELVACDGSDSWHYNPHSALLRHQQSGLCLRVSRTPLKLWLEDCDQRNSEQKWYFSNYDDQGVFTADTADTADTNDTNDTTPRTDL